MNKKESEEIIGYYLLQLGLNMTGVQSEAKSAEILNCSLYYFKTFKTIILNKNTKDLLELKRRSSQFAIGQMVRYLNVLYVIESFRYDKAERTYYYDLKDYNENDTRLYSVPERNIRPLI